MSIVVCAAAEIRSAGGHPVDDIPSVLAFRASAGRPERDSASAFGDRLLLGGGLQGGCRSLQAVHLGAAQGDPLLGRTGWRGGMIQ